MCLRLDLFPSEKTSYDDFLLPDAKHLKTARENVVSLEIKTRVVNWIVILRSQMKDIKIYLQKFGCQLSRYSLQNT